MKIKECKNIKDRFFGIMFKRKKIDKCYFFPNCNSIHTFFCFQNIDIIMTDKNNNILFEFNDFKPWNIILPKKKVKNVYEFPSNTSKKEKLSTINR